MAKETDLLRDPIAMASERYKDKAKFKLVAYASHAQNPTWFTTAPIEAMKNCLNKANMNINDIHVLNY